MRHHVLMQLSFALDHLVVTSPTLDEGQAYVEAALGVALQPGGQHDAMGTYNRLLSLGPQAYLEVIAIDPNLPGPENPRWFGLDQCDQTAFSHWALRTNDLTQALAKAPAGSGRPMALTRGDFAWTFSVTPSGHLPFDDAMPALLEWGANSPHPCDRLEDRGCRFVRLDVVHPRAAELAEKFPALSEVQNVTLTTGPAKRLRAIIATPNGEKVLE